MVAESSEKSQWKSPSQSVSLAAVEQGTNASSYSMNLCSNTGALRQVEDGASSAPSSQPPRPIEAIQELMNADSSLLDGLMRRIPENLLSNEMKDDFQSLYVPLKRRKCLSRRERSTSSNNVGSNSQIAKGVQNCERKEHRAPDQKIAKVARSQRNRESARRSREKAKYEYESLLIRCGLLRYENEALKSLSDAVLRKPL